MRDRERHPRDRFPDAVALPGSAIGRSCMNHGIGRSATATIDADSVGRRRGGRERITEPRVRPECRPHPVTGKTTWP